MAYLNETIKHLTELNKQIDNLLDMGLTPAILMSGVKICRNSDNKIIVVGMENDCIRCITFDYHIVLSDIGREDWREYISPDKYFLKLNNVTMKKILPQIIS